MEYAEVDGSRLAFRREGAGPPMLLLHGIATHSFLWEGMAPFLRNHFSLIAPDLLGCGYSDKPTGRDYSIGAQAGLMTGLLDRLGVKEAHVVAHDIGGGVAQIMAAAEPARLRSLSLINTVGFDYWPVQPIVTMRVPILRHLAMAAFDLGVFRMLVTRGFHHRERLTPERFADFMAPLRTREGKEGFLRLAECLDNSQLLDTAGRLRALTCPVTIIRGAHDIYLKPVIAERLHREIPGSHLEVLPTAGHFAPLDEPEQTARIILEKALVASH